MPLQVAYQIVHLGRHMGTQARSTPERQQRKTTRSCMKPPPELCDGFRAYRLLGFIGFIGPIGLIGLIGFIGFMGFRA